MIEILLRSTIPHICLNVEKNIIIFLLVTSFRVALFVWVQVSCLSSAEFKILFQPPTNLMYTHIVGKPHKLQF